MALIVQLAKIRQPFKIKEILALVHHTAVFRTDLGITEHQM